MTTKTKWRLAKLPTPDELRGLVADKIITNEEAREILISQQDDEDRDVESLKSEIQFLRSLVKQLSSVNQIVTVVKESAPSYQKYPWYGPYYSWCSTVDTSGVNNQLISSVSTAVPLTSGTNSVSSLMSYTDSSGVSALFGPGDLAGASDFDTIKTF